MNKVWLKRLYIFDLLWIFVGPVSIHQLFNIESKAAAAGIAFLILAVLAVPTFYFMYQAGKDGKGAEYAKKNLFLAIGFSFFALLGLLLWPPLVLSEINKAQQVAGGDATR